MEEQTEQTAIKFFKSIEHEQDKYKLVNGLFIVKYDFENKEVCRYVCEFLKVGSVGNHTQYNKVILNANKDFIQRFNKNRNLTITSLGIWKPLNISFKEEPIKKILEL